MYIHIHICARADGILMENAAAIALSLALFTARRGAALGDEVVVHGIFGPVPQMRPVPSTAVHRLGGTANVHSDLAVPFSDHRPQRSGHMERVDNACTEAQ